MKKEKARQWGEPIPNAVVADTSESSVPPINLQALHLTRRCAISIALAAAIAPLAFGERT